MLERLQDLPEGVLGVKATGTVSKDDYVKVLEPLIDEARRDGRRIRFLYQCGPDFKSFTAAAAWEDASVGLRSMRLFDACAIVSDVGWIRDSTRIFGFLMPCPVRVFALAERDQAVAWLAGK